MFRSIEMHAVATQISKPYNDSTTFNVYSVTNHKMMREEARPIKYKAYCFLLVNHDEITLYAISMQ